MKKIFAILISALIVLSSFSIVAFAKDVVHISVDDVVVKSGENIEMPVKISNNNGIWGLVFNIHFDTKAFQVKEVRSTGKVFNKSDIMIGPADFNDGYVRVVVTPADVMNNNTNNGTICTIILEQTEYAVATTYPFTFEYENTDFINVDAQMVPVSSTDGSVSIVGDSNKPTTTVVNKATVSKENITVGNTVATESVVNGTTAINNTNKEQISTSKKEDLGDIIAQAEDNKIIDNYNPQNQTEMITDENSEKETKSIAENKDSNAVIEKDTASNIAENNNAQNDVSDNESSVDSPATSGDSANPTSNMLNVLIYVGVALLIVGVIALIVVLVKRKNK